MRYRIIFGLNKNNPLFIYSDEGMWRYYPSEFFHTIRERFGLSIDKRMIRNTKGGLRFPECFIDTDDATLIQFVMEYGDYIVNKIPKPYL